MTLANNMVGVVVEDSVKDYPRSSPYHPPASYPECPLGGKTDRENKVYPMVRNLLNMLGLDSENFGCSSWNPFKSLIREGNTVVIKPNFVGHDHPLGDAAVLCAITHGSVLRAIIDYVYIALKGKGRIIVCDTPLETADFGKILSVTGVGEVVSYLKDYYPIEVFDLRRYRTTFHPGRNTSQHPLAGDPLGYVLVDLGKDSEFSKLDSVQQNYHTLADHSVDHYDPFTKQIGATNQHHNSERHEYLISRTILSGDVIISVPKLKVHGKAGVSLSLKNMVGVVSGKEYMPHHRPGSPPLGDAFPSAPLESFVRNRFTRRKLGHLGGKLETLIGEHNIELLARWLRTHVLDVIWPVDHSGIIEWGDWHGNDTVWRMILDLNKVVFYCDTEGNLREQPQRRHFSLIDGIVGQEGAGPRAGNPISSSLLIGGLNPVSVDAVASCIMGLDPERIPTIKQAKHIKRYSLRECDLPSIETVCNGARLPSFRFRVPKGWEGHIEREQFLERS